MGRLHPTKCSERNVNIDSRFATYYTTTVDLTETRRLSHVLFGHRYRLELLAALTSQQDEGVCVSELATFADAPASVFHAAATRLAREGLVISRKEPVGRRVLYQLKGLPIWSPLAALVTAWDVPAPQSRRP